MENEFTKVMSERTDDELIEIITIERKSYNQLAIEAAESEIKKRKIKTETFNEVKKAAEIKKVSKDNIDSNAANSLSRFINFIIDYVAWYILSFIIATVLSLFMQPSLDSVIGTGIFVIIVVLGSFFLYFGFMEYKFQKTLGKFITKTKVVKETGKKPDLGDIMTRTFCRLIPLEQFSFLFFKSGLHDRLSETMVIYDKKTNANNVYN